MDNRFKLLIASFMTLIAAGVGFGIRNGGILAEWGSEFNFSKEQLGTITGGGLAGFGFTILVCCLIADKIGYKTLLVLAFVLHVMSAVITYAAIPMASGGKPELALSCLYWGAFVFALGNGVCEAVINPLVASLYPDKKTHYLNILHAGWPGGLIIGGLLAFCFVGPNAYVAKLPWIVPMSFFLIPTLVYGFLVLMEKFPPSETEAAGVSFAEMLSVFASPILLFLLVLHGMIGYVELGTDSWITDIMNNVMPGKAILLFVYASALMFILRFFAGPIVERINPVGLLLASSVLGAIGLYSLGSSAGAAAILVSYTVYAFGKTFLWPTILGVVGERFPKGGALVMGAMGGIGMLSAGYLGGPMIGKAQDYFASQRLEAIDKDIYAEFQAKDKEGKPVASLDASKIAALKDVKEADRSDAQKDQIKAIEEASIEGGQGALKQTAMVPAMMAVGFLLLVFYFQSQGGYKQEKIGGHGGH